MVFSLNRDGVFSRQSVSVRFTGFKTHFSTLPGFFASSPGAPGMFPMKKDL